MHQPPKTRHRIAPPPSARRSAGFTLVELMVSVALALVILAGMGGIYLSISRANADMTKANDVIESGRIALDILSEDVAHAGFWGSYVPQFDDLHLGAAPVDIPTASPDPCLAFASWDAAYRTNLIGIPIQVFGASPSTACTTLGATPPANTDILVVRRVNNCNPGVGNCEALDGNKVYFQASNCDTELAANNRFVLANAGYVLTQRDCATIAPLWKYISNLYYVRNYASSSGDNIPTLMRSVFDISGTTPTQLAAEPLVEGIQGFVIELGIDAVSRCGTAVDYTTAPNLVDPLTCTVNAANPTFNQAATNRGDGTPEAPYVRCAGAVGCTPAQLVNAVSAQIYVLARSRETTPGYTDTKTYTLGSTTLGPFSDGFKRHVYQMTVRLNNVAGRRETS